MPLRLVTLLSQHEKVQEIVDVAIPELVVRASKKKLVRMYTGLKITKTKQRKRRMIRLIDR